MDICNQINMFFKFASLKRPNYHVYRGVINNEFTLSTQLQSDFIIIFLNNNYLANQSKIKHFINQSKNRFPVFKQISFKDI